MDQITRGNAHEDGAPFGKWFVGDLEAWAKKQNLPNHNVGLRQSSNLEVKWGLHPTGEQRMEWAPCSDKLTLSLLVRGRFVVKFRSPESRERVTDVCFDREGDYAVWGTDVEHTWEVLEEAVILTVRWKQS